MWSLYPAPAFGPAREECPVQEERLVARLPGNPPGFWVCRNGGTALNGAKGAFPITFDALRPGGQRSTWSSSHWDRHGFMQPHLMQEAWGEVP